MHPERRRQLLLVGLLVVLLAVLYKAWNDREVVAPGQTAAPQSSEARRSAGGSQEAEGAPAVHLDALDHERPKPSSSPRDLFRFGQRAAPPSPGGPGGPGKAMPAIPAPPPGPPSSPPIALKFIGIVEQGGNKPKVAILTDGLGPPLYAVEGGTVAGRYRVLRIGAESIEMEYLDGRGRQTIRLSGS